MLTGSVFPAMVWHALNNGSALLANHYRVRLALLPLSGYLSGLAILIVAFWILWRTRA